MADRPSPTPAPPTPRYEQMLEAARGDWWDSRNFDKWKSHYLSEYERGRSVIDLLRTHLPELRLEAMRVLDIGCGTGAAVERAAQVVGPEKAHAIDPTPRFVELTRKRVRTSRELQRKGWRDFLSDAHYGLGWRIYSVDGQELVTHSGWVSGFVAQVAYSPAHDTGLALLLNAVSLGASIGVLVWVFQYGNLEYLKKIYQIAKMSYLTS